MKKHIEQKINVLFSKRQRSGYVMKISAFFILDALIGMLTLLIVLHLLLSVLSYMIKTKEINQTKMCDPFYISMKIQSLGKGEVWHWEDERQISITHSIIYVTETGEIIKSGVQGGYENIGTCSNIKFKQNMEGVEIVFEKTKNEEEAIYSLA